MSRDHRELRDLLRAVVADLLSKDGTQEDLRKQAEPLGVVFPWEDYGRDIEALRTIVGRVSGDSTYSADQAVADARALGIAVTDPNPQLVRWREAEAECRRYEAKLRVHFKKSGVFVDARYELSNGDIVLVRAVRFGLDVILEVFNETLNYAHWMSLEDFLKRGPR